MSAGIDEFHDDDAERFVASGVRLTLGQANGHGAKGGAHPGDASSADATSPTVRLEEPLASLAARTREDVGAPFTAASLFALERLRETDAPTFQRLREQLKDALKGRARISDLDAGLDRVRDERVQAARAEREREARARAASEPVPTPGMVEGEGHERRGRGYVMAPGMIEKHVTTADGPVRVETVAYFSALILAENVEFDGIEEVRTLEIEVTYGDGPRVTRTVTIPASEFLQMGWLVTRVGAGAAFAAGAKKREDARAAIQFLSRAEERRVYTFTGWHREPHGAWMYLHANGAVGGEARMRIEDRGLARLALPAPLDGSALRDGVRACLELVFCGPPALTVPLFSAPWRAALGNCHTAVYVQAEPETGKTTAALWAQSHFGTGFDCRGVPATWESTAFGINRMLATAGDCVLLLDDFTHHGRADGDDRIKRLSDVVRPLFSGTSKTKGTADSRTKKDRPARSLPIITGEALPKKDSLLSRLVVLSMTERLPLDVDTLAEFNERAASGVYAGTMAAFIRSLVPRFGDVQAQLPERIQRLERVFLKLTGRARGSREVAELAVGLEMFLEWARDAGALTADEHREAWDAAQQGFRGCAEAQAETQASEDVVARALRFLWAAISAGHVYVAPKDRPHLSSPEAWGHQGAGLGPRPGAYCVGYTDEESVWLNADNWVGIARQMAEKQGESLDIDARGLGERLSTRGLLTGTPQRERDGRIKSRGVRLTVKGTFQGTFLKLAVSTLRGGMADEVGESQRR